MNKTIIGIFGIFLMVLAIFINVAPIAASLIFLVGLFLLIGSAG